MRTIEEIADYILIEHLTIREASKIYGIPKSTLHNRLQRYMAFCDDDTRLQLEKNFYNNSKKKHKRGGMSFKNKYTGKHKKEILKKYK